MIKINLVEAKGYNPAEIFQSLDIKFAFLSKVDDNTYKQQHLAIKCRDFLGDCIWGYKTNNPVSIYGFNFDNKNTPIDTDKVRLSIKFPNKESKAIFKKNLSILHIKEQFAGIGLTRIITCNKPLTYIIESDSIWQSSVWKMSLFSFYLKFISYLNVDSLKDPEDLYFKILMENNNEFILLKQLYNTEDVLEKDINMAHNYSGFVSILKNQNKEMNKILLGDNE